jgi:AcrR family transcriptional regulator
MSSENITERDRRTLPMLHWVRPPRQERSRDTHQRIVEAAERLLAAGRAWSEISVAELVKEAGTSIGSFYHRFRDKDALLHILQIDLYAQGEATAASAGALGSNQLPLGVLIRAFVSLAVNAYRQQMGIRRALMVQMTMDLQFRERAQELSRMTCETLTDVLAAHYRTADRERLRLAVDVCHRLVYGVLDQNLMFADRPTAHTVDDATLVDELCLAVETYLATKLG